MNQTRNEVRFVATSGPAAMAPRPPSPCPPTPPRAPPATLSAPRRLAPWPPSPPPLSAFHGALDARRARPDSACRRCVASVLLAWSLYNRLITVLISNTLYSASCFRSNDSPYCLPITMSIFVLENRLSLMQTYLHSLNELWPDLTQSNLT